MKLKDLKKIIAEEIKNISAEQISEGPCGGICYWNGVKCCSTACDGNDCLGCCMDNLMGGSYAGKETDHIGRKGGFEFKKGPGMKMRGN